MFVRIQPSRFARPCATMARHLLKPMSSRLKQVSARSALEAVLDAAAERPPSNEASPSQGAGFTLGGLRRSFVTPQSPIPDARPSPCYACLYRPPREPLLEDSAGSAASRLRSALFPTSSGGAAALNVVDSLVAIAQEFSPRYERHRDDLVSIDVSGLERLLGTPRTIGEELRREASARGTRVHVAVAATRMAALVLAHARPGLTVVDPGEEAAALASVPIGILEKAEISRLKSGHDIQTSDFRLQTSSAVSVFKRWGIRTLGELAALPPADLSARLGQDGLLWRAIARGEDTRPLVPDVPEERFESSIELDWPIEGLEPLSFVLTRLLEPLSIGLERRDRGAAVLHVVLRLVTCESHARHLELPSPIRDVRTLRTLALLDLESHPPPAAIDRVAVAIDPTPGRVLQHRLFTRAHPTPEQLSTLLARLGALMGQDRIGAPARVDSYGPGTFEMRPFATDHERGDHRSRPRAEGASAASPALQHAQGIPSLSRDGVNVVSSLRRCRQPVPARVAVDAGRPVRVTTDRRSFAGGAVLQSAGPWRTSGHWWDTPSLKSQVSRLSTRLSSLKPETSNLTQRVQTINAEAAENPFDKEKRSSARSAFNRGVDLETSDLRLETSRVAGPLPPFPPLQPFQPIPPLLPFQPCWDRDEWDVALGDGAVYRIFRDRETDGWFLDAIVD